MSNSFNSIDVSLSGLKAQARNMEAISSNVANVRTTDTGNGQPYRRLEAVLKAADDGIAPVEIDDVIKDMNDFQKVLARPGDPRADSDGYISMPNVDIPEEMVSLNMASRSYQANVAVLKRYQTMVNTTLELLK